MKVFWFIVASIFFLGGFALFAYSFQGEQLVGVTDFPIEGTMFTLGVVAVSISFAIPFHLLEKFD